MSADGVYRKIGRGGAGNFYAANETTVAKDLEAQTPDASPTQQHQPTAPSRAGRGGAGNWIDPGSTDASVVEDAVAGDERVVAASQGRSPAALSGRGGVGNWKTNQQQLGAEAQTKNADDEQESLEQRIKDEVEQELKMPEKVHHAAKKHTGR